MATTQLSSPETGWTDKNRTALIPNSDGSVSLGAGTIFTCNGAGSTTTLVGAAAVMGVSNAARVGERFVLVNSAGQIKESKVFTVTAHNGTTTVTFTPAAAVATASGDIAKLVSGDPFADNGSLDAKLLAMGGVYTQKYIDSLTQNDKVYAIRQFEVPDNVK